MPLDSEKLDELKSNIAFARKRPLAFGLCLGKAAETTILLCHKTKDPETVGRQAKKEGETAKLAFGMMTVEGKNLNLSLHGDTIPGLARKTKEMLKAANLKMKVRILDAQGNTLEEDGDEEDEDAAAPDPQKDKWAETRPRVEEALAKAGANAALDLAQPQATWAQAIARAEARDFPGALSLATETVRQISAAVEALRVIEADRARWQEAAAKLRPQIEGMGRPTTAEMKKIAAFWAFAQSKAEGATPDFGSVMKTVAILNKMIAEMQARLDEGGVTGRPTPGPTGSLPPTGRPAPEPGPRPAPGGPTLGTNPAPGPASGPAPTPAPAPVPGQGFVNGAPPVTPEENARLLAMSDEELLKVDLTRGNVKDLFSHDYMQSLRSVPIKGEGDPNLKELMREITKGEVKQPRRKEVMEALARIVGNPPSADKLDADYGRFLVAQKQQNAAQSLKGKEEVPALDEDMHPRFMGSRSQLIFGKVLGDAFDIHEVFAALLSPTGGLVGPGNWLIEPGKLTNGVKAGHLSPDNPVALHGTVHDAAGYLVNYHNDGPGYNYLESDMELFGTDNPLAGQASGIAYWVKEAGPEYVVNRATEAVVAVEKKLKEARDAVAAEIDKQMEAAKKKAAEVKEAAKKAADLAKKTAAKVGDAILDAAREVEKKVKAAADAARAEADRRAAEARRQVGQMVDTAKKAAGVAKDTAVKVGDAIVDASTKAGKAAVKAYDAGQKKIEKVTKAAESKLKAAWKYIWS